MLVRQLLKWIHEGTTTKLSLLEQVLFLISDILRALFIVSRKEWLYRFVQDHLEASISSTLAHQALNAIIVWWVTAESNFNPIALTIHKLR